MEFHMWCKRCKQRLLTLEEMQKHFDDQKGLCNRCREKEKETVETPTEGETK